MQKEEEQDSEKLNLSQFKRHTRRFPWALLVRIVVALIAIGMIWYVSELVLSKSNKEEFKIEIEYQ